MPQNPSPAHIAFHRALKGRTMTISDTARLDMLAGLRTHVGEAVANTLIEHLPPGGWYDIARTGDIDRLREDVMILRADMNQLRTDMNQIRTEMNQLRTDVFSEMNQLRVGMKELSLRVENNTKWMIGISLTYGIGILGALVTFVVASLT